MNKCYTSIVFKDQGGQAMILAVTVVTGALVGATAIAGNIMLRQIRQFIQSIDSTKAIFATETGIEYGLYKFNKEKPDYPSPGLEHSGATFVVRLTSDTIRSVGTSKSASRALEVSLSPLE